MFRGRNFEESIPFKVVIFKILVLVGDTQRNGGLILRWCGLNEKKCQKNNRRPTNFSVHTAVKQIHIVLTKFYERSYIWNGDVTSCCIVQVESSLNLLGLMLCFISTDNAWDLVNKFSWNTDMVHHLQSAVCWLGLGLFKRLWYQYQSE